MGDMQRWQGLIGILVLLGIAFAMSDNRRRIPWRVVVWGLALQFGFAVIILRTDFGQPAFTWLDGAFQKLLSYNAVGADFLFKPVMDRFDVQYTVVSESPPERLISTPTEADRSAASEPTQVPPPSLPPGTQLVLTTDTGSRIAPQLTTFAFVILPTVIFFSALLAVLYHLGVMQWIVRGIAWVMVHTMGTSGAETLSVAADIFVGQTEAPLMVRPYLARMTRSELLTVMVGGFATIAGGVMAMYVGMLHEQIPGIAGHLMAASVMGAPATLVIAKIICPETETPVTLGTLRVEVPKTAANIMEAFGDGVTQGLQLALNIAAMLLAFVAIMALVNGLLGWLAAVCGFEAVTLQQILGELFRPLAWTLGVDWSEAGSLGRLLGEKLVLTELIAYQDLAALRKADQIEPRTALIASYALCGFANFASIGIQIGGLGAMAPECKPVVAAIALRAMIGGALATCLIAAIAGILL